MLWFRTVVVVCAVVFGLLETPLAAQTAGTAPPEGEVASDPIRCWWKTDRTAVRVGERFGLTLTCSVIEAGTITVVPALNQLEPGALSLTPFEVLSGVKRDDVVAPPWRYIQFEYVLRLLSDGFFGQDVNVPALTVTYNLRSAGGATQGRDQGYILPALPMRILSVVPGAATDIRDASGFTFATVESRRFRASAALLAAGISFAFATVLAGLVVVRSVKHYRTRHAAPRRPLPSPSLLRGCLRELKHVRKDSSRDGWTPELARRAVSALRIAAAVGLGRPPAQDIVGTGTVAREGQLSMRTGWIRRRRALLSAPTTPRAIAAVLSNGKSPRPLARSTLESISGALQVLSLAGYGRNGHVDATALDSALDDATRAVRRMRLGTFWPARTAGTILQSLRSS
jgi:hypothetical protein